MEEREDLETPLFIQSSMFAGISLTPGPVPGSQCMCPLGDAHSQSGVETGPCGEPWGSRNHTGLRLRHVREGFLEEERERQ